MVRLLDLHHFILEGDADAINFKALFKQTKFTIVPKLTLLLNRRVFMLDDMPNVPWVKD